eukprot:3416590-Rhodomonas_salina.1
MPRPRCHGSLSAWSGTRYARWATILRVYYAEPGTEVCYAASRDASPGSSTPKIPHATAPLQVSSDASPTPCPVLVLCTVLSPSKVLRRMSGTDPTCGITERGSFPGAPRRPYPGTKSSATLLHARCARPVLMARFREVAPMVRFRTISGSADGAFQDEVTDVSWIMDCSPQSGAYLWANKVPAAHNRTSGPKMYLLPSGPWAQNVPALWACTVPAVWCSAVRSTELVCSASRCAVFI